MSEGVHHAAAPGDADATVVQPVAGRRPGQFRFAPSLDRQATAADLAALGGLNPLVEAANPLLAAVPQIRHALRHPDPGVLRARLRKELDAFERAAQAAGVTEDRRFVARYALCAVLDDAAAATPWGQDWIAKGLVSELHGDAAGTDKFFALLEPMLAQPDAYADLLEFFYACLALGYEGRYRGGEGGRLALAQIRTRLLGIIAARRPPGGELSPRWHGAQVPLRRNWLALVLARLGRTGDAKVDASEPWHARRASSPRTGRAGPPPSCRGICSSARRAPARPPRCCTPGYGFRWATRSRTTAKVRCCACAARAIATGGSLTRQCCSTPPAATPPTIPMRTARRGSACSSC
jgi:type IV/VI secretion system ImpK/VasF family protein